MTAPAERKNSLGPTVEQQDKAMARLQKRRRGDGFNPITGEPETGEAYDEARRDAAIAREDIKRNIRTEDPPSNRVLATSNAALQADNAALRAQVAELAEALAALLVPEVYEGTVGNACSERQRVVAYARAALAKVDA